ncbi:YkyA family protein [Staphylococcus canis]|uniref:Lipoprotein n=1 Tax=Staphylococcus canis TaxID=2724942 RepID=A0ABS0TAE2_9STAP|nr:YkyA family protein [Staphylococcus canis]MBI5975713.1 hypothetical protein [Staphylococcus canis]
MKGFRLGVVTVSVGLLVAACSNQGADSIKDVPDEGLKLQDKIVSQMNSINHAESGLQKALDASFKDQASAKALTDEKGPVFDWIQKQSDRLDTLNDQKKALKKEIDQLSKYQDDDNSKLEGKAKAAHETLNKLYQELDGYTSTYRDSLDKAKETLKQSGKKDAKINDLEKGLDDYNASKQELNKHVESMNRQYQDATQSLESLKSAIKQEKGGASA